MPRWRQSPIVLAMALPRSRTVASSVEKPYNSKPSGASRAFFYTWACAVGRIAVIGSRGARQTDSSSSANSVGTEACRGGHST